MQLLLKNNSGLKSNLGLSFRINTRLIYITYPQVCILASSGGVIERYQFNDYSPNIFQVCQRGLLEHLDRFHYMLTLSEVALQVCVRQDGRTLLYPPNNLATALIQAG